MDISKEVRQAINSKLPKEVGDALSERLEKIDKLEATNEQLEAELEKIKIDLENANSKLASHKELDEREKILNERDRDITSRENKMDVHDAQIKAEQAEERAKEAKQFVEMIFHSPVYRKAIDKPIPISYGQGQGTSIQHEIQTEEKTVE